MMLFMNINMLLLMNKCITLRFAINFLPDQGLFLNSGTISWRLFVRSWGSTVPDIPILLSFFLSFPNMSQPGLELYLEQKAEKQSVLTLC